MEGQGSRKDQLLVWQAGNTLKLLSKIKIIAIIYHKITCVHVLNFEHVQCTQYSLKV